MDFPRIRIRIRILLSFGSDRIRIHNTGNVEQKKVLTIQTKINFYKKFFNAADKGVLFTRKCLNVGLQTGGILGAVELEQAGLVVLRLEPGGGLVQPSPNLLLHLLLHHAVVVLLLVAVLLFRVRLIVVAIVESVSGSGSGDGGGLITEDDTARVVQRCAVLCL
jgi:hypothetical protein